MRHVVGIIWGMTVAMSSPVVAVACTYPGALMTLNTTLMDIHAGDGRVGQEHRARLRDALGALSADALRRTFADTVSPADMHAVDMVLTASADLASGRMQRLDPEMQPYSVHLSQAAQGDCADPAQTAEGGELASALEHGIGTPGQGSGQPLTFRQGMTRLSIAFTIYAVFLAAVIAIRRWGPWAAPRPREQARPPPFGSPT